jgi:hypothetical protein
MRELTSKAIWLTRPVCARLAALLAAALLCATAAGPLAPGGRAQTSPGIKTDRAVYPEPPLPALPPAGGKYIDPVFGT